MMVLVIRHVALEGYKYIRRSGNIVCVFMCKVDIDSWPSYYFNGSYYIFIYIYIPQVLTRFYLSPHFPPTFEVVLTRILISPYVPLGHQLGSALWLQLCNIWAS